MDSIEEDPPASHVAPRSEKLSQVDSSILAVSPSPASSAERACPRNSVPEGVHNSQSSPLPISSVSTLTASEAEKDQPRNSGPESHYNSPMSPWPISSISSGNQGGSTETAQPRNSGPDSHYNSPLCPMPILSFSPTSSFIKSNLTESAQTAKPRNSRPERLPNYPLSPLPISSVVPTGSFLRGDSNASSIGTNLIPHMIDVYAGEDINEKILSIACQGPRTIFILSAAGIISEVVLHLRTDCPYTLHKGAFNILSLSGYLEPHDDRGLMCWKQGMTVTLLDGDNNGRIFGGNVFGKIKAGDNLKVLVVTFKSSNEEDEARKTEKRMPFTRGPSNEEDEARKTEKPMPFTRGPSKSV